jgi:hypothetical protein
MTITIQIFTKQENYTGTKEIKIPEEELREFIESNYLQKGIILESFYITGFNN